MLRLLQVLTVMVVSVAMGLALAHALEYPGKLRLSREEYQRPSASTTPDSLSVASPSRSGSC
jgi:hypothetical protein